MKEKKGRRRGRAGKLGIALLLLVGYLAGGAVFPFLWYQPVTEETQEAFDVKDFCSAETGVDRAMLLESNESAWEHRIRLLDQARYQIILSTFDMRDGESTRDLLAVIWHKAEEGVQVKILVDGISGLIRMEPAPLFSAVSSHPNIEIRLYNPVNLLTPWTSQGRMHDKYLIVDSSAYILGGRNTFDYFLGSYDMVNKSLDREVLVWNEAQGTDREEESSLFAVEAYFQKVWELDVCRRFHGEAALQEKKRIREQIRLLEERYQALCTEHKALFQKDFDYEAATCETNQIRLISGPVGIYGKEPQVLYAITELMKQAKERVIIHTPYIVSNGYMNEQLRQIGENVPDARLVINSVENGDNFVASSDYQYHKKDVVETGLAVYEYDGGYSTHGKSFVIDEDLCGIGSYNFDLRSTYMDTELMLVIQSKELTTQLREAMEVIERDCRKVVDEKNYIVPEHVVVAKVPLWKRAAWKIVGFLLQPVRCLA